MSGIKIITDGGGRRRRWSAADKLRIAEESLHADESISAVARRNGVAPSLLYHWRKLTLEGGSIAVTGIDSTIGSVGKAPGFGVVKGGMQPRYTENLPIRSL